MYLRIVATDSSVDREAENAHIERFLHGLGHSYTAEPHAKGGLAVHIADEQIDDIDSLLEAIADAGLLAVL